jgi:hypothetical protein
MPCEDLGAKRGRLKAASHGKPVQTPEGWPRG